MLADVVTSSCPFFQCKAGISTHSAIFLSLDACLVLIDPLWASSCFFLGNWTGWVGHQYELSPVPRFGKRLLYSENPCSQAVFLLDLPLSLSLSHLLLPFSFPFSSFYFCNLFRSAFIIFHSFSFLSACSPFCFLAPLFSNCLFSLSLLLSCSIFSLCLSFSLPLLRAHKVTLNIRNRF